MRNIRNVEEEKKEEERDEQEEKEEEESTPKIHETRVTITTGKLN